MNQGLLSAFLGASVAAAGLSLTNEVRTAGKVFTQQDAGKLIDLSGTFTQNFPSYKGLSLDWALMVRNTGTGFITVTPSGAETLDGRASYVMYPQECRLFFVGTGEIKSIVLNSFEVAFTTPGATNFIKPPGYPLFTGELYAGGSAGGKYSSTTIVCYGGNGGAYAPFSYLAASLALSESVVVGAGGVQTTSINTQHGAAGGNSTFKNTTAFAGGTNEGGAAYFSSLTDPAQRPGYPAAPSAGVDRLYGGSSAGSGAVLGKAVFGGACGESIDGSNVVIASNHSLYGGDGGVASLTAADGTDGAAPGGGGGASRGGNGGAGGRGEVRIRGKI